MLQIVHDVNGGTTRVVQVPEPIELPGHVVVGLTHSVISAGTERYVVQLAKSSFISKARQRPDHVRRVIQKLRDEGLLSTVTQVRAKLQEPLALGYSAAGLVLASGPGVHDLKPGDRVAVAASHAAVVSVGRNLCAPIPVGVSFDDAAYAPLGAIALQGVRLAHVEIGSRVLVVGLGLLGLITVGLLKANGCHVWGTDLDAAKTDLARAFGADGAATPAEQKAALASAGPDGFDAVIITAASPNNSTIELAADVVRARGRVVAVGLVGLDVPREPFFRKEVELTVSHSLGVGRGDARYESSAHDYPVGQARWTVRRNIETVLAAIASGAVPVSRLTSHRFSVQRAADAYELITRGAEPYLGVVLEYDDEARQSPRRVPLVAKTKQSGAIGLSVIGAGNYARLVMLPKLAELKAVSFRGLCTGKGLNASETGCRYAFAYAASDVEEVLADAQTDAVIIATRHDLHADFVVRSLRAGKHVFVEKPLCLTVNELQQIERQLDDPTLPGSVLMTGFNRRFAEGLVALRQRFAGIRPLAVHYRFAVPELPADIWVHDDATGGGRIIGEACHAIDACAAIITAPPVRVYAESAAPGGTVARADDRAFITMRHADGSVSSVSYLAGGDRSMPPERIEVIGGGISAVLDNWSEMTVWSGGTRSRHRFSHDKGHRAALHAFVEACRGSEAAPIAWAELRATSLAAILAERSTREGMPFEVIL
jgi:predicted dehydrogenase/threonine dehydrogenase-like Zn-dependent dehydrogenase